MPLVPALHERSLYSYRWTGSESFLLLATGSIFRRASPLGGALLATTISVTALGTSLSYTTGALASDMGVGAFNAQISLAAWDVLFFRPNEKRRRRMKRARAVGEEVTRPSPLPLWERVKTGAWELNEALFRGAAKDDGLNDLLARSLNGYIVLDMATTYLNVFHRDYLTGAVPLHEFSMTDKLLAAFTSAVQTVATLELYWTLPITALVAAGVYAPRKCPRVTGPWSAATSVRSIWGKCYHQLFRRIFTSPSLALCEALEIPPRSTSGQAVRLLVGFGLSAALHWFARYSGDRSGSRTAAFFLLQPCGIALEVAVSSVLSRYPELQRRLKPLAYVWSVGFVCATSLLSIEEDILPGSKMDEPVPISFVRGLVFGKWLMW